MMMKSSSTLLCRPGDGRMTSKRNKKEDLYGYNTNGGLITFAARNSARRREVIAQHSPLAKSVLRRNANSVVFGSDNSRKSAIGMSEGLALSPVDRQRGISSQVDAAEYSTSADLSARVKRDRASLAFSELSAPTEGWRRPPTPDPRKARWSKRRHRRKKRLFSSLAPIKKTKNRQNVAVTEEKAVPVTLDDMQPKALPNVYTSIFTQSVVDEQYRNSLLSSKTVTNKGNEQLQTHQKPSPSSPFLTKQKKLPRRRRSRLNPIKTKPNLMERETSENDNNDDVDDALAHILSQPVLSPIKQPPSPLHRSTSKESFSRQLPPLSPVKSKQTTPKLTPKPIWLE
eukprot:g5644.t1